MKTIPNYVRPQSPEEAYQPNQARRNRLIGGMMWLRLGGGKIDTAIDQCGLGLDSLEETEEQFSIGKIVINTPAPAIAHAIYRATGVWHRELPITPEQITLSIPET